MNLVLTGYKCSGKSTVGRILSEMLNRDYLDIDEFIETNTGLMIREIFELCGEEYFRLLEESAIREITKKNGAIISTGGGVTLMYRNVKRLSENGAIVYLEVSPSNALERLDKEMQSTKRKGEAVDFADIVLRELSVRVPYYEDSCIFKVCTDGKVPYDVANEIVRWIQDKYESMERFFDAIN